MSLSTGFFCRRFILFLLPFTQFKYAELNVQHFSDIWPLKWCLGKNPSTMQRMNFEFFLTVTTGHITAFHGKLKQTKNFHKLTYRKKK